MKSMRSVVAPAAGLLPRVLCFLLLTIFLASQLGAIAEADMQPYTQPQLFQAGVGYFNVDDCSPGASASATPSAGGGGAGGGLVWPFATKSSSQYNRVDEGWDIQDKPSADIYAIGPGTLDVYLKDTGNFGDDYPVEHMDNALAASAGFDTNWVYYGHVHILPGLKGKHVDAGQKIATANGPGASIHNPENGSGADPGWLEIGFAVAGTDQPVAHATGEAPSAAGQKMKDLLLSAQPSPGAAVVSSAPGTPSCACTSSASSLVGNGDEDKIWNYFKSKGLSDEQAAGVLGNIADETGSTWDPEIVQGGGHSSTQPKTGGADGWGLVQWTYPYQDVSKLLHDNHVSGAPNELQTQLDLIWAQMNGTSPTGVNNMAGGLKGINDVSQAATYFSDNFEGGVPGSRVSDALDAYAKYKGTGGGSTGPTSPSGGGSVTTSDTLNGHKLPATVGGTGLESFFSHYALGTPANQNEDNYYITMRWRYDKWNWNGTSVPGPESIGFYQGHPKVLVTNPRNHKSIIAIALEAGPAPWTGVDPASNNNPKEGWTNPQDGTPSQYKGRVSGFPPPATHALGAIQTTPSTGDKLEYAWAPDQNATPGPTNLSVDNAGGAGCATAGTTGSGSNSDIVSVAKQELALGLKGTGPLNNGGPVCKYEGSGCSEPWCADFVSWVYKTAGKPFTGGHDGGWRLSLASEVTGYFLSRKGQPDIGYGTPSGGDKMEPGWTVSFSGSEPGDRGIGHVGIVVKVNSDGTFDYIDGNGAGAGVSENKHIQMSSAIDWGGYK